VSESSTVATTFLKDLWNEKTAASLPSPLEMLRYRSNLLGDDLRITNFGGGNTSSKFDLPDPLTGEPRRVMAVKGSGGDLRSIGTSGFAILYMDKLNDLVARYRGEAYEDEMVGYYPLCAFGENRVAASIDTPLHAYLPFPHVDHLHPDWAIALAASANGKRKLDEFNKKYGRRIVWVPWQRPGFELALMLKRQDHRSDGRVRRRPRPARGAPGIWRRNHGDSAIARCVGRRPAALPSWRSIVEPAGHRPFRGR
jgi:rhamnose utilization protein RhaD (predicted bifunctional aldolase and dehydrogenase)